MSDALFVVFGAGQIGQQVTERLLKEGHRVRQVRRSGSARTDGRHELVTGDLSDRDFAAKSAAGATALVHCAVPPYHQWHTLLEPMNEGVLHAASTTGAPLVVLDNLYGYGRVDGPMREDTPLNPVSKKGELRARIARRLLDAHAKGEARVTLARAADFYGPGITLTGIFGERFFGRLKKGQAGECFGPPERLHSYTYGGDVAEALVTLATQPQKSLGQVWHVPTARAESTAATVERFGREFGFPGLKTNVVPGLVLHAMALFVPAVKELLEMRYQWERDFVLDDTKFTTTFGVQATSLDEGVKRTVAWLRQ